MVDCPVARAASSAATVRRRSMSSDLQIQVTRGKRKLSKIRAGTFFPAISMQGEWGIGSGSFRSSEEVKKFRGGDEEPCPV